MPTKKRRVGFIPRNNVLDLINNLSHENNLSYSKIINILVEEALNRRGLFNVLTGEVVHLKNIMDINSKIEKEIRGVNTDFNYNFKNKFYNDKFLLSNEEKDELLDNKIFNKFIMFLQFQEKMKKESFD